MFAADVLKLSHDSWDAISEQMNEALGYTDVNIEHDDFVDDRSTTGGNFVTGLMLSYTMEDGVDAAFTYSGGICTDFEVEDTSKLKTAASTRSPSATSMRSHLITITG